DAANAIGAAALAVKCDVTDDACVRDAFARVVAAFGGVDIVVSNAGAAWQGRIGEVDEDVLRQSFELNFIGIVFVLPQGIVPALERWIANWASSTRKPARAM